MNNIFGPNRQTIRLRGFDYASTGVYFVTICTQNRMMLLGDVINGKVELSPVGEIVQSAWKRVPMYGPHILLDEFMVMPNHFHGIVLIGTCERGFDCACKRDGGRERDFGQGWYPAPTISLSSIIGRFKSWTTWQYRTMSEMPLGSHLWQRNYYERIIRNDRELENVREYIRNNPANWKHDSKNIPL